MSNPTIQPTPSPSTRDLLYNSILSWADNRRKSRKKSTFNNALIKQCAADLRKDERFKGVSSSLVKDVLVEKGVVR